MMLIRTVLKGDSNVPSEGEGEFSEDHLDQVQQGTHLFVPEQFQMIFTGIVQVLELQKNQTPE